MFQAVEGNLASPSSAFRVGGGAGEPLEYPRDPFHVFHVGQANGHHRHERPFILGPRG
jgi:hypothetical protein